VPTVPTALVGGPGSHRAGRLVRRRMPEQPTAPARAGVARIPRLGRCRRGCVGTPVAVVYR